MAKAVAMGGLSLVAWVSVWGLAGLLHSLLLGGLERFVATLFWCGYGLGAGMAFALLVSSTFRSARLSPGVGAVFGLVSGFAGLPLIEAFSPSFGWYWLLVFSGDALLGALLAFSLGRFDKREARW